jgi:hypothetical protein
VCLEIVDAYSQFKLENKWQHETIFLDLYYIKNNVGAKNGLLLEAKNNVLKGFSQKKSHWFITNLFSNMVEDIFFPFYEHYLHFWAFVPMGVWDKFIMIIRNLKGFVNFTMVLAM